MGYLGRDTVSRRGFVTPGLSGTVGVSFNLPGLKVGALVSRVY